MRKKIIIISFLSLFSIFLLAFIPGKGKEYNSYLPPPPPGQSEYTEFLIGAMDNGLDKDYAHQNQLNFNYWHKYAGLNYQVQTGGQFHTLGWDWYAQDPVDRVENNIFSSYRSVVESRLSNNLSNGMRTLMDRPKLERLCFGQRSDYQAEAVHENSGLWFYTFNESIDGTVSGVNDVWDESEIGSHKVKRCLTDAMNPGSNASWILKRLKANNEQVNTGLGYYGEQIQGDKIYDWYIKPRIRIDSNVAHNNGNSLVCKIVLLDYNTDTIRSIDIRALNFVNPVTGNYDGSYLEEFFFSGGGNPLFLSRNEDTVKKNIFNPNNGNWPFSSRGNSPNDVAVQCKMDIQVYWYGECDMWLDYVRVDNDVADQLFKGEFDDNWLTWEGQLAGYNFSPINVYIEEFEFNNIPCMKYVSEKIYEESGNKVNLMCDLNYGTYNAHLPGPPQLHAAHIKDHLIDEIGLSEVFMGPYPFDGHKPSINPNVSKIPSTLPITSGDEVLASSVSPSVYEDWLQTHLDVNGSYEGGVFTRWQKIADTISKQSDIPYINLAQAQVWYGGSGEQSHRRREPTTQEQEMMANVSVTYGAKGLMYFWYDGFYNNDSDWAYGLTRDSIVNDDSYIVPRYENAYGQSKWQSINEINEQLYTWSPYIMRFTNNRQSYHYSSEKTALLSNTYFNDIVTYTPQSNFPFGYEYNVVEDESDRYVQAATFMPPAPEDFYSRYFMIVNRRCSPHINPSTFDNNGGRRRIEIQFNGNPFIFYNNQYNNWKIIDVENNETVATFYYSWPFPSDMIDLGMFEPGEGKLYKLIPVVVSGGTLVGNEVLSGNITCFDTIFTNGYNLTIADSSSVTFDTNGTIVVNGGNFSCGEGAGYGVTLSSSSPKWNGISLIDCDTVTIHNTTIEDVKDTAYAFDILNCEVVEIKDNNFNSDNCGGIRGTYTDTTINPDIVIYGNDFTTGNNNFPIVNFTASSSSSIPLLIDDNTFFSPSTSSSSALMLTNISGGAIKNNTITNFYNPVLILSSSLDLYNNTISTGLSGSAITGSSGSIINMAPEDKVINAGFNIISNTDPDAHNIYVNGSYFIVHEGHNAFDISDSYDGGKHFNGYFPGSSDGSYSIDHNCFTYGSSQTTPITDVTWGILGDPVTFAWSNECEGGEGAGYSSKMENNYIITPITGSYSDTIKILTGGTDLTAVDSLYLEMRKQNYTKVIELGYGILTNSPETMEAYDAISKLYASSLRIDNNGDKIAPLKSFLEQLILDNGENAGLVKRAFYFIQKCKAALGDYQSAMAGFEDIMNNNPNTYEALVASWDYSATALLMNGNGQGGGMPSQIINNQLSIDNEASQEEVFSFKSLGDDPDDRDRNSKGKREQIKINVIKTFEETRKEEISIVNKLKERSDRGDKTATKELKRRELIQAVVEKRQPADIFEHIQGVSSDIKTVFNSSDDNTIKNEQNTIPTEFELSQNFPNPFNPTTKIQFALPMGGKVQLVIYDILGREVAKLVNNEFRTAGRYVNEFNGSRLASGIYFYRISVDDGKVFDMVKKMVLVK